ncbi:hypothetical protein DAPPUDRAFT_94923 [Daphnia pulex]|uniref:Uncharacterized protein n=1 Tax=Daphnia pulex TaxID=6669 RepID=E9FTG6_DAPPU|nr:hypothetical protein DAPPUDRAFT_94923 [Daphnia pulex]|eukprot:EFX89639.1 hypothetical protein DAPPUDRAFT_94923 [Daphnia pulex]
MNGSSLKRSIRKVESGLPVKKPAEGKVEQPSKNNNSKGSRSNINRTPLRSKIPQAVTTPPAPTRLSSGPAALRSARPSANNNRASTTATTPSNIVAPKVVSSKTSGNVTATPLRQHNSQAISSRMLLASRTTPSVSHQRLASATTATSPSSTNLLKSVKAGLPVVAAQPPATCSIQGSRIPRPSSSSSSLISSGGQPPKSSPSAASARLVTHATSSSPGLSAAHRHPSSPSLLLQGNNRTTATTTAGVKSSSSLHKSTSRLHLTHKGESSLIRSDLVSAH